MNYPGKVSHAITHSRVTAHINILCRNPDCFYPGFPYLTKTRKSLSSPDLFFFPKEYLLAWLRQGYFAVRTFCSFWASSEFCLKAQMRPLLHLLKKNLTAAAAAAAKSLQSYSTLCDPTDGSSPGSPVPGILQARTLEWVAISFSNAGK